MNSLNRAYFYQSVFALTPGFASVSTGVTLISGKFGASSESEAATTLPCLHFDMSSLILAMFFWSDSERATDERISIASWDFLMCFLHFTFAAFSSNVNLN